MLMPRRLKIAVSQFPITADVFRNLLYIKKHVKIAKKEHANLTHFPECCLTGYPGIDYKEFETDAAIKTQNAISEIRELAKKLSIWVILGSNNFEKEPPYNTLFVINDKGEVIEKYHKRMLYGDNLDLKYYSPGKNPVTFTIKGIRCGLLICHEWRYPELYRQYHKLGVELLFQSWYDGNLSKEKYLAEGINQGEILTGFARGNAANNYLWVSASNTCKMESCFPAMVIQPDGVIQSKLKRNVSGVLISEIDFGKNFPDPSKHNRGKIQSLL